jgi:hypothetical protein
LDLCILELPQLRGSTPATPLWGSGGKGEGKCGVRDHPRRRRPRPCHLSIRILSNYYLLLKRRTEYIGSSAVLSSPGHIQCACKVYLALLANQIPHRCDVPSASPVSVQHHLLCQVITPTRVIMAMPAKTAFLFHSSYHIPMTDRRYASGFDAPVSVPRAFGSRTPDIIHHEEPLPVGFDRIFHWRCISGSVFGGSPYPCDIKD